MKKRYNIALIPIQNQHAFIKMAEALSSTITPATYMLSANSFPHVSVCHFATESEQIDTVWKKVKNLSLSPLTLSFTTRRGQTYPNNEVAWVSLIPNHIDNLMDIHLKIAAIIKHPLNAAFADYDPHLTLFNSLEKTSCEWLNHHSEIHPPLTEEFVIALGESDDVGQFTKILF
ncbi:MAG TPA: hypothetical protein VHD33_04345 [Legionellaceae bacterium]|nr:hypothetical protein [Legionellaceae bacterium]